MQRVATGSQAGGSTERELRVSVASRHASVSRSQFSTIRAFK